MNREEVISMIKRNKNKKKEAVILIADFLCLSKADAEKIYEEDILGVKHRIASKNDRRNIDE